LLTKWGRVGAKNPGCDIKQFPSKEIAIKKFKKKFYDKTENSWDRRH